MLGMQLGSGKDILPTAIIVWMPYQGPYTRRFVGYIAQHQFSRVANLWKKSGKQVFSWRSSLMIKQGWTSLLFSNFPSLWRTSRLLEPCQLKMKESVPILRRPLPLLLQMVPSGPEDSLTHSSWRQIRTSPWYVEVVEIGWKNHSPSVFLIIPENADIFRWAAAHTPQSILQVLPGCVN